MYNPQYAMAKWGDGRASFVHDVRSIAYRKHTLPKNCGNTRFDAVVLDVSVYVCLCTIAFNQYGDSLRHTTHTARGPIVIEDKHTQPTRRVALYASALTQFKNIAFLYLCVSSPGVRCSCVFDGQEEEEAVCAEGLLLRYEWRCRFSSFHM